MTESRARYGANVLSPAEPVSFWGHLKNVCCHPLSVAMAVLVGAVRGDVFKSINMDIYLIVQWFKRRWAKPEAAAAVGAEAAGGAVPAEAQEAPETAESAAGTEDAGEEKPAGEKNPE